MVAHTLKLEIEEGLRQLEKSCDGETKNSKKFESNRPPESVSPDVQKAYPQNNIENLKWEISAS